MLQCSVCEPFPTHSVPPWAGAGFVHVRARVLTPPPQVFVQACQWLHSLQTPSTGAKRKTFLLDNFRTQCHVCWCSLIESQLHDSHNNNINININININSNIIVTGFVPRL